jgi:hypothetical protein
MVHGEILSRQTLTQARERTRSQLSAIDPKNHPVEYSRELLELTRKVREEVR